MVYYILSDQHFGAWKSSDAQKLRQWELFVDYLLMQSSSTLILAGDFFDFWISYSDLVRTAYLPVLSQFKRLSDAGISVVYVRGNHDFMSMDLLRTLYGVVIVDDQYTLEFTSGRVLIEHGDRVVFSLKHSIINRILWSPFSQFLYRLIPPNWAIPIALRVAHLSRARNCTKSQDLETSIRYRDIVRKRDVAQDIAVSIIGHVHYRALEKSDEGWIFANPGTWLKAPTFLRLQEDVIELCELNSSGNSRVLKREQIQSSK